MRSLLFLLVLLPVIITIRCYAGWNTDYLQVGCSVLDVFCYKLDPNKDGYTEKGGGGLCCCSGDYCNSSPSSGLLPMILIAAATAAWLRL